MSEPSLHQVSVDIAEIKRDLKGVWKRIDEQMELTKSVNELTIKVETQGTELKNLVGTLTTLVEDIGEIKQKPAKRWEGLIAQIISILVAGVFAYLLARLGLK